MRLSPESLWSRFIKENPSFSHQELPKCDHFGDNRKDADKLAKLVNKEIKRATSHSLLGLQYRNEPLPKIDDLTLVTDWASNAKCIIKTVSVRLLPFFAVNADHARLEGEGNKSLDYWKKVHWDYYTRELAEFGKVPTKGMIVVFEQFEKIFG